MLIRKLVSQTAIYGISPIVAKFLNYLLTPYLTRVMGLAIYGQVSLLYSAIPFANVLLTMGLATGYFRYAAKCNDLSSRSQLFTTTWGAVTIVSVIFGLLAIILGSDLAYLFKLDLKCVLATALLIVIDNISAIPLAALRERGRGGLFTLVNVSGVVVNVTLCWLFYSVMPEYGYDTRITPFWVIIANVAASSVSLLILLPSALKNISRSFSPALLKNIFNYSIPLMMAGIMGVSGDFIDRPLFVLLLPDGEAQLGIYGGVAKVAALMMIFRQIYTLGAEPFFLQGFSKEDFGATNAAATKYFTIVGIAIFLLITLFADTFALILGPDYRVGMDIVPMLLLANLFAGLLVNLSFWYKAADRTRIAIYITGVGVFVTLMFNLALIPSMGYHGAAIARVVSTALMVVISYFLCQKYYPVPFDLRCIGLYFLIGGGLYTLSFATAMTGVYMQNFLNFLLILIFGLVAFQLEFRGRNMKSLWKK